MADLSFTYHITTYGCQMNEQDSSIMSALLDRIGGVAVSADQADLLMFNTCCVREHAEDKVFGNVGAIKKRLDEKPNLMVGVCGCMMQQPHVATAFMKKFPFVNFVMGTHNTQQLPEIIERVMLNNERVIAVWEKEGNVIEGLPIKTGKLSSYVNIMYGCNNFCTYCIVPYVRGRERSRTPDAILNEINCLASTGTKEVMLLGQNVNSYQGGGDHFAELLYRIDQINGIERIRFMTSHPKDISVSLMQAISECKHVCKQLHLPVQSGNDRILKRMNRHYSAVEYLEKVDLLRSYVPNISLTTDIIVGFPEETDDEFNDTFDLIKKVRYVTGYFFKYSPRPGTPAAKFDQQISDEIKQNRLARILELQNQITSEYNQSLVGKVLNVLPERKADRYENQLIGRSDGGRTVHFIADETKIGSILPVTILGVTGNTLYGESK